MAAAVDAVAEDLANATVSEPADAEAAAAAGTSGNGVWVMGYGGVCMVVYVVGVVMW